MQREQMNIVIVGHVDHGTSTLVGRLLSDTGAIFPSQVEKVRGICLRQGKEFEWAFLLDALEAEQDQGITIDSARCFFKSERRDYIIIDAPGHKEFLKNMVSGAARAEAAVLLIDAHEGVRENSRRHGLLLSLLGIGQVVVAVNKMDLVGWDEAHFRAIEAEYRAFLAEIGVVPRHVVPIAARDGANLTTRAPEAPWWDGPTVLEAVDGFQKEAPPTDKPLRMPVQDVYRFNAQGDRRRIVAGRVETGRLRVGDRVVFAPSGKTSTIASLESFTNTGTTEAAAGESIGVTLTEQIYVRRGDVMCHMDSRPKDSTLVRVTLFWLGRQPMEPSKRYKLKLGTAAVEAVLHEVRSVLDASTLETDSQKAHIDRFDVAEVVLRLRSPIAADRNQDSAPTGRFVIVDGYDTTGGGIVREMLEDAQAGLRDAMYRRQFEWHKGHVLMSDREARQGHRAGVVLFSGGAGTGKALLARHLEKALYDRGLNTYLLDGNNVLLGVDHGESGDHEATREQLIRRYGEVANLMTDAGLVVVSTTNTIGLADHQKIATLVAPAELVAVHVDPTAGSGPPQGPTLSSDLVLSDVSDVGACTARLMALLDERGFFHMGDHAS